MCIWEWIFGKSNRNDPETEVYNPTHYDTPISRQPRREPVQTRATLDFEEQLRRRQVASTPRHIYDDDLDSEPVVRQPAQPRSTYTEPSIDPEIERQRKEFEQQLQNRKNESIDKENRMRREKMESDRRGDSELQEAMDEQNKEHEETYRRVQEEIDEYERETRRLLYERIAEWKANQDMLIECVMLKRHFEDQQREWSAWLDTLSDSISSVKTRYNLFQKVNLNLDRSMSSYQKIVKEEMMALHKSTLSSYDLVYEAWSTVKGLAQQVPDRIFLKILAKDLGTVANKLCSALRDIDECIKNTSSLDRLPTSFSSLNPRDIPSTLKLQERSRTVRHEEYLNIPEPHLYRSSSSVGIVDVSDRQESFF